MSFYLCFVSEGVIISIPDHCLPFYLNEVISESHEAVETYLVQMTRKLEDSKFAKCMPIVAFDWLPRQLQGSVDL